MTNNQIQYQRLLEEKRSHLANEDVNRKQQIETGRHNLATEVETNRSNLQNELLKHEGNIVTEQHYQRSDALGVSSLAENIRNNKARLAEEATHNRNVEYETRRANEAREYETHRSNETAEAIKRESNSIQAWRGAFPGSGVLGQIIGNIAYDRNNPVNSGLSAWNTKVNAKLKELREKAGISEEEARRIDQLNERYWQ